MVVLMLPMEYFLSVCLRCNAFVLMLWTDTGRAIIAQTVNGGKNSLHSTLILWG